MSEQRAAANTDRELWREREGDYYASSIHVTVRGGIGINVGGRVFVKSLAEWHALATRALADREAVVEEAVNAIASVRNKYGLSAAMISLFCEAEAAIRSLKPTDK